MLTKLKNLYQTLKENVFLKYPVTICAIWLASLMTAFVVDLPRDFAYEEICIKITVFLWIFAAGNLFTEEFFGKKAIGIKIAGFSISGIISFLFVQLTSLEGDYIFGVESDLFMDTMAKILACYLVWIAVLCIYRMYKNSEASFEKYCISVFGSVMRTSIVYGLFALGLACIIWIVDVLLFDTDDFIFRIEVFLVCALYVPGIILAVSKVQEEIGKFLRLVVKFVLLILTIAAFVIIYLYIIKIIVSFELPSNEVFPILSWLFVCGMPVWTVAMYYSEDKLGKIAGFLPYAFIPFILLQCLCIGLRIGQYGLTDSRYICCFLIVAEIIYLILFIVKKRAYLPVIFLVAAGLVTVFLFAPVLKYDSMVYLSQKHRFEKLMDKAMSGSKLSNEEIGCVKGAYDELKWSMKGKKYIDKLSGEQKGMVESLREQADESLNWHDYKYINYRWTLEQYGLNVENHTSMYDVRLWPESYTSEGDSVDMSRILFEVHDEIMSVDLTEFVKSVVNHYEETNRNYNDEWLYENGRIQLPDGAELQIYEISLDYTDKDCTMFRMHAYYME